MSTSYYDQTIGISRDDFAALHGDLEIVIATQDFDEDSRESRVEYETLKGAEIFDHVHDYGAPDSVPDWSADFHSIRRAILDGSSYDFVRADVLTAKEYEERKLDEARRQCEPLAADVARRYDVKPGTTDFCRAIEQAIEDAERGEDDQRYGMREDGLCASGGSRDAWFDDYNGIGEVSSGLRRLREWFQGECPMLWAKYEEAKLHEMEVIEV